MTYDMPTMQILCHDGTPLKRVSESTYTCPNCGETVLVTIS